MRKGEIKGTSKFLKALPYALLAIILSAIVVIAINVKL